MTRSCPHRPSDRAADAPQRRQVLGGLAAASVVALTGRPDAARAQSPEAASQLVNAVVSDVLSVINSGRSEAALLREFERIFRDYADVPIIAQSVLGPPWRSASAADRAAFTQAFQGYMARKYGRRFREFQGGQITVSTARPVRNFVEVVSAVRLPGRSPFEVRWLVSDGSGRNRFFNLIIEGVNLMITERTEIGAMLDARRGDVARLAADLRNMG